MEEPAPRSLSHGAIHVAKVLLHTSFWGAANATLLISHSHLLIARLTFVMTQMIFYEEIVLSGGYWETVYGYVIFFSIPPSVDIQRKQCMELVVSTLFHHQS